MEAAVESLGARGDGIARLEGRPLFLPLTLPGDRVLARVTGEKAGAFHGEVIELRREGPGRVEPPCPHFGLCGGCGLQHLDSSLYATWKEELLRGAFERQGLAVEDCLRPIITLPPGGRRRATLSAMKVSGGLLLGFRERRGKRIARVDHCLLLTAALGQLIGPLRELLDGQTEAGDELEVALCETSSGVDLLITAAKQPDLDGRRALADFAEAMDLARLSWMIRGEMPEPVALRRVPTLSFSGVEVQVPPGGFVQPSLEGEAALIRLMLEDLPQDIGRAIDLYAGCGTFSFALARRAVVLAVEGDTPALGALETAAHKAGLAGRITATCRDLARQPLLSSELEGAEVVVFDPPRTGAREQAGEVAASSVPLVVAVSCNPNTLARDARTLVEGGYRLVRATPVDQFPWSGHLEAVALFRRC